MHERVVEVEREEIAVQFVRVPDGHRACVEVHSGDELVPGLDLFLAI